MNLYMLSIVAAPDCPTPEFENISLNSRQLVACFDARVQHTYEFNILALCLLHIQVLKLIHISSIILNRY